MTMLQRAFLPFFSLFVLISGSVSGQSLEQGITFFNQEKYEQAETIFQNIVDGNPDNAGALYYLGRIKFEENDHKDALSQFEKALEQKPESALFAMWVGNAWGRMAQSASLMRKGNYAKKCIAHYEKAIELEPTFIEARFRAIDYYVEAPGFVGGGRDKAEAQALEVATIDPKEGFMAWGIIYSFFEEEQKLVTNYESAIEAHPEFMPPYFELFEYFYASKQFEDAAEIAKAQLTVNDTTEVIRQNLNRALEHLE